MLPLDVYAHKLDILAQHCERVGRDPTTVRKMIHFAGVIAEDDAHRATASRGLGATMEYQHGRIARPRIDGHASTGR
jgi:alkanesulfonate monooxygenase SsuD/methylene tetrahydromethanopterin reductase-like flavin-dependent oxidoreductase (luciferase family)